MTVALPYTEDFTGTAGQPIEDTADRALSGAGTSVYSASDTINAPTAALWSANGNYRQATYQLAAEEPELWLSYAFTMPADPPPVLAYLMALFGPAAARIADVRVNADRTLTLRDFNTAKWTSAAIAAGTQVRVNLYSKPGNASGLRARVYTGSNLHGATPSQESPLYPSTVSATTVASVRVGIVTTAISGAFAYVGDRLRVATTEPAGSSTAPDAPVLAGTAGAGQVALTWTQGANGGSAIASQELQRSLQPDSGWTTLSPAPIAGATSKTDSTVVNGTAYYYRLRVTNSTSTSPWSNVVGPLTPQAAGTQEAGPVADVLALGVTSTGVGGFYTALDELDPDDSDYVAITRGGRLVVRVGAITTPIPSGKALQIAYRLRPGHRGTLTPSVYEGDQFVCTGEPVVDATGGGQFTVRVPAAAAAGLQGGTDLRVELAQS